MRSPSAALTKLTQQRLDSIWRPRLSPKSGEKGFRRFWRKGVSPMVHPRPLNPQGVSRPVCPYAGHRPSHPEIPRRAVGGSGVRVTARYNPLQEACAGVTLDRLAPPSFLAVVYRFWAERGVPAV